MSPWDLHPKAAPQLPSGPSGAPWQTLAVPKLCLHHALPHHLSRGVPFQGRHRARWC